MRVRGDRAARGIHLEFATHEVVVLRGLLVRTLDVLTDPEDPSRVRLLPDGYRDDPDAAAEFARYTRDDLRRAKVGRLEEFGALLDRGERRILIDRDTADRLARALTDMRRVLAEVAGVTDDESGPADPRMADVYEWFSGLQWGIVDNLDRLDRFAREDPDGRRARR